MEGEEQAIEKLVFTRLLRLNELIMGLVTGLIGGVILFVATAWLVLLGGPVVGPHLGLLNQFFFGYEVTLAGSVIGFGYGFASGFTIGYLVAWLYNRIAELRQVGTG